MKKFFFISFLFFIFFKVVAQQNSSQEEVFRKKIDLEIQINNANIRSLFPRKAVSNFNGKTEFWSIANLTEKNMFISITSFSKNTYFQEFYFVKNGKLRYAKEVENYNPINGFAKQKWNCEYYFDNNILVTLSSLGHGKTEDESWNPDAILMIYKKRILELNRLTKE